MMRSNLIYVSCLALSLCSTVGAYARPSAAPSNPEIGQTSKSIPVVKGTVLDQDGQPVIGATVIIKGTSNGTVTDFDGNYVLRNVPQGATVEISFIGYVSQQMTAQGASMGTIKLKEDNKTLNELVVIGYGTQRKADLTGSVANVDASKLNTQSNATIGQALQGKIAGVDIVSQGGYPGSGTPSEGW